MTASDFRNAQLALACWRPAKTELHTAMLCVCQVFMNRAAAGWYDGDLYDNVCHWLDENPGEFPDTRDPQFGHLLSKLDSVTSGLVPDKTGGAMYFSTKEALEDIQIPEGYKITTTIGNMVFIK